jgi:hypothetical protein
VRTTAPKIIFYTGTEPPETDIMHCLHSAEWRLPATSRSQQRSLKRTVTKRDAATALARHFCHALAEETAGLASGSWCMVQTMAQRMDLTLDEASTMADDYARRNWIDHRQHTVSLREGGRLVAAAVRKAIVSKRPPTTRGQKRLASDVARSLAE